MGGWVVATDGENDGHPESLAEVAFSYAGSSNASNTKGSGGATIPHAIVPSAWYRHVASGVAVCMLSKGGRKIIASQRRTCFLRSLSLSRSLSLLLSPSLRSLLPRLP